MNIRLLVADDHPMLRAGLRRSLGDQGFDVIGEAKSGTEAVQLAARLQPDVVLMDVGMPGLDGVTATKRIKESRSNTNVVMLTMHTDRAVVSQALDAGASGYLLKDSSIDQIADAVRYAAAPNAEGDGPSPFIPPVVEPKASDNPPERRIVTRREEEVLQLIADGCSTTEVAERLYISQKTVKNHLASIYQKLDARDRTQAILRSVRLGIVTLN